MKKVVITGVGAISVLGNDHETIAKALYEGKCGLVHDSARQDYGYRSCLTGAIQNFKASEYLNRKQMRSMPDFAKQAYAASLQAITQANLDEAQLASDKCAIIFSNDSTVKPAFDLAQKKAEGIENTALGSGHIFQIMNSTISMNLGVLFGIRGGSWTVSSACSGGLLAVLQAADAIALGRQDIVLCGGAQEINPEVVCSFDGLSAFSLEKDPSKASRPFDKNRDGLVPSGGAAAIILESEEHAIKRGAKILGTILGSGYSSDGLDLVVPSHAGLGLSMQRALDYANLKAHDITDLNAHATSTPLGDTSEAINILNLFGEKCPNIMALKALTGHELWMAGAGQVVYATLMAQQGFTAGNPNFIEGDEITSKLNISSQRLSRPPKNIMCNAAGFGGSNASVIVGFYA